MKDVFVFTNIAPHYRKSIWDLLLKDKKNNFHFLFGENSPLGIQPILFKGTEYEELNNRIKYLKNLWINDKILIWQRGIICKCLKSKFDIAIMEGEMNTISNWVASIICYFRGIEVVFWGHGIYGNESNLKLFIRKTYYKLATKHLLYERRAKHLMINEGFKKDNLYIIFNSLEYESHLKFREEYKKLSKNTVFSFFKNTDLPVLVFIGRLTAIKKLDLLFHAVHLLSEQNLKTNLVIIGDGPERENLEILRKNFHAEEYIYFTGASYNELEVGRYLFKADLCISPGNIGLTAIHSLSYGTPICTHNNFNNQMPEAEAIIEGYNGFYFNENDLTDLVKNVKCWLTNNKDREIVRNRCYRIIDQFYNPNYQLKVFNQLINNQDPEL